MSSKPGRNEPCPCGSGMKYKHCHLRDDAGVDTGPPPDALQRAVERAIAWLTGYRRKAFVAALDELIDEFMFDSTPLPAHDLSDDFAGQVQVNFTEWLLAEGSIQVKGSEQRTVDHVLGPDGPAFSPEQRLWIEQLRTQALRLYTVTGMRRGSGLTLRDALDSAAAPLDVDEDLGSLSIEDGTLIGARVLRLAGRNELSGAMYAYAALHAAEVIDAVRAAEQFSAEPGNRRMLVGREIMRQWVREWTQPRRLPRIEDAGGNPLGAAR